MKEEAMATHEGEAAGEFYDMDEAEFEAFLAEAIQAYADENDAPRTRVSTFSDEGLLTSNNGIVVRIGRTEFQLTIVRSR